MSGLGGPISSDEVVLLLATLATRGVVGAKALTVGATANRRRVDRRMVDID